MLLTSKKLCCMPIYDTSLCCIMSHHKGCYKSTVTSVPHLIVPRRNTKDGQHSLTPVRLRSESQKLGILRSDIPEQVLTNKTQFCCIFSICRESLTFTGFLRGKNWKIFIARTYKLVKRIKMKAPRFPWF